MRRLLITGGTGSFGNAVLKRALVSDWDKIRIFSRDEKKQNDMRLFYKDDRIEFILGDVVEPENIDLAMSGCSHVFHAAALKQVPSCEFFPKNALETNSLGTYNVIRSAKRCGVSNLVVLSTDKACYPINAMGVSKAMAEKIALAEAFNEPNSKLTINITRYGNVMGSRGSVIPLFYKQAQEQQALTITNPEMTRFMMSLEQSVDLVFFALETGKQGELFIQKALSATVLDIGTAVSNSLNQKINFEIIGIRGGEKIYETLVTQEEMSRAKDAGDYYIVEPDVNYLGYNKFFEAGNLDLIVADEFNSHNASRISVSDLIAWFNKLEFSKGKFID